MFQLYFLALNPQFLQRKRTKRNVVNFQFSAWFKTYDQSRPSIDFLRVHVPCQWTLASTFCHIRNR